MKYGTWICIALASIALVGCGKDKAEGVAVAGSGNGKEAQTAPIESKEMKDGDSPMDLLPTTIGSQAVYEVTQVGTNEKREITLKVANVKEVNGKKIVTLETYMEDPETKTEKKTDQSDWEIGPEGVAQRTSAETKTYDPPQPVLKFPIKVGEESTYEGVGPVPVGGQVGKQAGKYRVRSFEEVDTPMGTVNSVACESLIAFEAENEKGEKGVVRIKTVIWLAPKYGIVRFKNYALTNTGQQQEIQSLAIKSFSEKK
ncbi:MAG: hypothetical protein R2688_00525 [Fimbriimonadaceae bacterium]